MNTVRLAPESMPEGLIISPVYKISQAQGNIQAGAILPDVEGRRPATNTDLTGLWAEEDTPPSALVEVFSTPGDILKAVQNYNHSTTKEEQEIAHDALVGVSATYGGEYLFMRESPAHVLTTTAWPDRPIFAGMYVDNRDKLSLARRTESRRRMGINAGPGHRWLLMCFPDIIEIAHTLGRADDSTPGNTEFQELIDTNPHDVQCLWIPIRPDEMYISPSDLGGHDGSAWDSSEGSAMHFVLGHWERNKFTDVPNDT